MVIFYRRLITNPRKGRYVSSVHNLVNDFWCGCLMLNKASMHKMFVDVQYYFYSCHHYPSNKARAVRAGEAGVPHKDLSPEVSGKPRGQGGARLSMFLFCKCAVRLPLRRQGKFSIFFSFFQFSYSNVVLNVCSWAHLPALGIAGDEILYIYMSKKKEKRENPASIIRTSYSGIHVGSSTRSYLPHVLYPSSCYCTFASSHEVPSSWRTLPTPSRYSRFQNPMTLLEYLPGQTYKTTETIFSRLEIWNC